jgi:hypothetical protein
MATATLINLDKILDDIEVSPGPVRTATKAWCERLLREGDYTENQIAVIADAYAEGYQAVSNSN